VGVESTSWVVGTVHLDLETLLQHLPQNLHSNHANQPTCTSYPQPTQKGLSDNPDSSFLSSLGGDPSGSDAASLAPLTSQEALEANCYNRGGLCLMGLVDGRSPELDKWTGMLEAAAAKQAIKQVGRLSWRRRRQAVACIFITRPHSPPPTIDHPPSTTHHQPHQSHPPPPKPGLVSFVTVDAIRHPSLRAAFNLRPDQLPALAVVSAKRLRYALAPPSVEFGAGGAEELLEGVLSGKVATAALRVGS
jgi:hypothetical protein